MKIKVKYLYFLNPSTSFDEDSSLEYEVADNSNLAENASQQESDEIEKEPLSLMHNLINGNIISIERYSEDY